MALTPGGLLAGLAGSLEVMVNSLHSQGIDRPAPRLRVEAVAPDGQIEGVSLPEARFVVGVQWHPEYKVLENPFSAALFSAFARACHAAAAGFADGRPRGMSEPGLVPPRCMRFFCFGHARNRGLFCPMQPHFQYPEAGRA